MYLFVLLLLNILLDCSCSYNCFISASPGRKTKTAPVHSPKKEKANKQQKTKLSIKKIVSPVWKSCNYLNRRLVQAFTELFTWWVTVISINNPLQQTLHQVHVDFIKIHRSQCFHYRLWVILTKDAQRCTQFRVCCRVTQRLFNKQENVW